MKRPERRAYPNPINTSDLTKVSILVELLGLVLLIGIGASIFTVLAVIVMKLGINP